MQFSALKQELLDRGFTYLTDARAGQYINLAYQEICESASWPFLETTQSGTMPMTLTAPGSRAVLAVTDNNSTRLRYGDRRNLERLFGDLTATGPPEFWYFDGDLVKVYPANTSITCVVRSLKVPADLSAAGDTPLVPARWHYLIVDRAAVRAYMDNDEFQASQATNTQYQESLNIMKTNLLHRNYDSSDWVYSDPSVGIRW